MIKDAQRDNACLKNESFDDLLQECLIHWFFIKDQYREEAGASKRTFLNRITRNKLADFIKFEWRNKRRVFTMSESLDAMEGDEELIGKKERILMVEEQTISKITAMDLPEAMARATAGLSFRQKQLCHFLTEGMSIAKAGEKMGIPRTTLNEEVKRIREAFRKEGLEEYLR